MVMGSQEMQTMKNALLIVMHIIMPVKNNLKNQQNIAENGKVID